jgi:Family of unknown function (DUF5709)
VTARPAGYGPDMNPRDEQQPQGVDLGEAIQLDPAETLDGSLDADALDAGWVPPDRPLVSEDDAMTARGQQDGESLEDRLAREEPETAPADPGRAGRIEDTGDGLTGVDVGIDGGAASAEEAAVHVPGPGEPEGETEPPVRVEDPAADAELERAEEAGAQARTDALRDAR